VKHTKISMGAITSSNEGLVKLLNLFYGLVITAGFGNTLRQLVETPSICTTSCLTLFISTFIIAIGDWVIYHFVSAPFIYQSIFRLMLDLIFPILLFIMALFVKSQKVLLLLVFGYFLLSAIYTKISKNEIKNIPKFNFWLAIWCSVFCLVALFLTIKNILLGGSLILLIVCSLPWFIFWFNWLHDKLKPKTPEE
jgi:hypothetical protein